MWWQMLYSTVMLAISSLITHVQEHFKSNPSGREFVDKFCNKDKFKEHSTVRNNLLYFKGHLVIPTDELTQVLLAEFHPLASSRSLGPARDISLPSCVFLVAGYVY